MFFYEYQSKGIITLSAFSEYTIHNIIRHLTYSHMYKTWVLIDAENLPKQVV